MVTEQHSSMPPPGWYRDPKGSEEQRWWDGQQWTQHIRPNGDAWAAVGQDPDRSTFTGAAARELANPGLRFAAFLLDVFFVWAALLVLAIPLALIDAAAPDSTLSEVVAAITGLVMMGFLIIYTLLAEGRLGQTYGKHLLDIRIVSAATYEPIGTAAALGRGIIRAIGIYAFGLGVLWILWDHHNQAWHDKAAKSIVVQSPSTRKDNPIGHLQRVLRG